MMFRQLNIVFCQYSILFFPVIHSFLIKKSQSSITYIRRNKKCQVLPSPSIRPRLYEFCSFVSVQDQSEFLDVEFEKTSPKSKVDADAISEGENENDNDDDDDDDILLPGPFGISTSLIDVSLETGDPRWKNARVPFCRGTEYIDCKLAFMVDLEGQSYGIAIPFDDAVAIVIQEPAKDGGSKGKKKLQTKCIDPETYQDNEEYAELMEIFAVQVQKQLGEEFRLRKTPKVLTISGGLDKITNGWQDKVITKPFEIEDLLEVTREKDKKEVDKELESFYEIMRIELGEEEYKKTMDTNDDEIDAELNELMEYFNVPGAHGATSNQDKQGLEDLMESLAKEVETGEIPEAKDFIPDTENAALKLLGYTFRESGKSYYLVKPLKSYTLIGRHIKDEEDIIRFELLTKEEEKIIIPKLEGICQEELEANGLAFSSDGLKV